MPEAPFHLKPFNDRYLPTATILGVQRGGHDWARYQLSCGHTWIVEEGYPHEVHPGIGTEVGCEKCEANPPIVTTAYGGC